MILLKFHQDIFDRKKVNTTWSLFENNFLYNFYHKDERSKKKEDLSVHNLIKQSIFNSAYTDITYHGYNERVE